MTDPLRLSDVRDEDVLTPKQVVRTAKLIPLEEAQRRLANTGMKPVPTLRWISSRSKELLCYVKMGKAAAIHADAWEFFERGEKWPKGEEIESRLDRKQTRTGARRSMRGSPFQKNKKTAKLPGDALSEALELASRKRPSRLQNA